MNICEQIVAETLDKPGSPKRSHAYRRGMLDTLRFRLEGAPIRCPFLQGTAEFDAYFSGNDRGHGVWRQRAEYLAAQAVEAAS